MHSTHCSKNCAKTYLPGNLKTSLLAQIMDIHDDTHDIFRHDIISEVEARREPGLQLLVMYIYDPVESFALPKTLRHLFLSNR